MGSRSSSSTNTVARSGARWVIVTGSLYARIWLTALFAPWHCFREYSVERDQTRAIGFTMLVIAAWSLVGLLAGTASYPVLGEQPAISFLIWTALLMLFVGPVGIHLLTLVATFVLVAAVPERATVSETVQAISYALAPAVFLPIPVVEFQAFLALYGSLLLVYGLKVVHKTSIWRALLAAVLPAYLVFGIGFGITEAWIELLRTWQII